MWIYDRWGLQIYYTDDYDKPWNGCMNSPVQNDTYVYKIIVSDLKGQEHSYVGSVTLVRWFKLIFMDAIISLVWCWDSRCKTIKQFKKPYWFNSNYKLFIFFRRQLFAPGAPPTNHRQAQWMHLPLHSCNHKCYPIKKRMGKNINWKNWLVKVQETPRFSPLVLTYSNKP